MKKALDEIIYHKLLVQAEEAQRQGLTKLSGGIHGALTSMPEEDQLITYAKEDLEQDIYNDLWKVAANIIKYYDLRSVDAEKMDQTIEILAQKVMQDICQTVNVDEDSLGKLEPEVLGQK